jgi:hypothetical protein
MREMGMGWSKVVGWGFGGRRLPIRKSAIREAKSLRYAFGVLAWIISSQLSSQVCYRWELEDGFI